MSFSYHQGPLLTGKVPINLIWYGKFTPAQWAVITHLVGSLSSSQRQAEPSVAKWLASIGKYYRLANPNNPTSLSLHLGKQVLDQTYSIGKSLTIAHLVQLASNAGQQVNSVKVVLTASDVAVEGFCSSRCGTHSSSTVASKGKFMGRQARDSVRGSVRLALPAAHLLPTERTIGRTQQ